MQGNEVLKDALEKVSGRLRKAVGLNRHELGGLHNVVSQMKKERNRSVGILSKKQQDFIQKQTKLLPSLTMKNTKRSRQTSNKVIPLDVRKPFQDSQGSPKGISTNQYNVLPPIQDRMNRTHDGTSLTNDAKQQRISDYNKEYTSLQESINNAHKFAKTDSSGMLNVDSDLIEEAVREGSESSNINTSFNLPKLKNPVTENIYTCNKTTSQQRPKLSREPEKRSSNLKDNNHKHFDVNSTNEIDTRITCQRTQAPSVFDAVDIVAVENSPPLEAHSDSAAGNSSSHWGIVRKRLRSIAMMNQKQRQHERYLTRLYEEIRQCRYIRNPRRKRAGGTSEYDSNDEDVM